MAILKILTEDEANDILRKTSKPVTEITPKIETLLNDNVKARNQLPDGTYIRAISEHPPLDAQRFFFEEAYRKAEKKAADKAAKAAKRLSKNK